MSPRNTAIHHSLLSVLSIQVVALEMHVDHNHHVAYMLWQKQFVTMISFEMFAKIFDLMPVSTLEMYHLH